jgi:hypothetical protein
VAGLLLAGMASSLAPAQVPPGLPDPNLQNRIPAPLPPPPQAPIINGPLSQGPPPGVYQPRRLVTPSDRATACAHEGSSQGCAGARSTLHPRLRERQLIPLFHRL